jgi:hypothetical protein
VAPGGGAIARVGALADRTIRPQRVDSVEFGHH